PNLQLKAQAFTVIDPQLKTTLMELMTPSLMLSGWLSGATAILTRLYGEKAPDYLNSATTALNSWAATTALMYAVANSKRAIQDLRVSKETVPPSAKFFSLLGAVFDVASAGIWGYATVEEALNPQINEFSELVGGWKKIVGFCL